MQAGLQAADLRVPHLEAEAGVVRRCERDRRGELPVLEDAEEALEQPRRRRLPLVPQPCLEQLALHEGLGLGLGIGLGLGLGLGIGLGSGSGLGLGIGLGSTCVSPYAGEA